jgi:hypothetical protein
MKHTQFKQLIELELDRLKELTDVSLRTSRAHGGLRDKYVRLLQKYILPLRAEDRRPRALRFLTLF